MTEGHSSVGADPLVEDSELTCFVVAPIGAEGSEDRDHSDQVLKYIIRPVLEDRFGYRVIRADEIAAPGAITNQVLELVLDADIVVAVLTGRNPNVFYELGIRHAVHQPFVHLVDDAGAIPFDLVVDRAIVYRLDLKGVEKAKKALIAAVEAINHDGYQIDSPVSRVANLDALSGGTEAIDRALAGIRNDLETLRIDLRLVSSHLRGAERREPGDPMPWEDVERFVEQRLALERGRLASRDEGVAPPDIRMRFDPPGEHRGNPQLQVTLDAEDRASYRLEIEILGDLSDPQHAVIHIGGSGSRQIGVNRPIPDVYKRFDLGLFAPGRTQGYSVQPNPGIRAGMQARFRIVAYEEPRDEERADRTWDVRESFTIPDGWY